MTVMADKLKAAGVAVPSVRERVFNTILETGTLLRKDLFTRLSGLPQGTVNSQLWELMRDGAVASSKSAGMYTALTCIATSYQEAVSMRKERLATARETCAPEPAVLAVFQPQPTQLQQFELYTASFNTCAKLLNLVKSTDNLSSLTVAEFIALAALAGKKVDIT